MSDVKAKIVVFEGIAKAHIFEKTLGMDFKPEIGDWVRPLDPIMSDGPLPILGVKVEERYFNSSGGLHVRLTNVVIDANYEVRGSYEARKIDHVIWGSLGGGDILEHLEDSFWLHLKDECDE